MSFKLTRRQTIAGLSGAILSPLVSSNGQQKPTESSGPIFVHGIASGDPDHNSIVLWTRVSAVEGLVKGHWEVSKDHSFQNPVSRGEFRTGPDLDYTIKVVATGLTSGQRYFYRFHIGEVFSPVGRSLTVAKNHLTSLGIAVASCSNYPFGFFNAYQAIAADPDVDVVLHLGDYIYEYASNGWGSDTGERLGRSHLPQNEIVSLQDYRIRHAQYKGDAQAQLMHAAHPMIAIWDDHESANNPWLNGAQNHQTDREGDWQQRKAASLQAYYEWMPIREPAAGFDRGQRWQHYQWGDLASLITLETRHTGRAQQIEIGDYLPTIENPQQARHFLDKVVGAPNREMLSPEMSAFMTTALQESRDSERRWRVLGNQIPMARTHAPPIENSPLALINAPPESELGKKLAYFKRLGANKLPIYLDPWDGYSWAREKFYQQCASVNCRDLLVLTGDSHSFWHNQLFDNNNRAMGIELGTNGISSPGDFLSLGREHAANMDELLAKHNREILWTNGRENGYVRVTLTHQMGRADFIAVNTVTSLEFHSKTIYSTEFTPGTAGTSIKTRG